MPAKKGCSPEAAGGGHKTQAGTVLEGAAALAEDPPEAARADVAAPTPLTEVGRPLATAAPDPPPVADPVTALARDGPEVVAGGDGADGDEADAVELGEDVGAVVDTTEPAPSVTTPLLVTVPGVATVWAPAATTVAESRPAQWTSALMRPINVI